MPRKTQIASNDREIRTSILQYGEAKSKLQASQKRLQEFFPSMTPEEFDRLASAFSMPLPDKPGPKPKKHRKTRTAKAATAKPTKRKVLVKNDEVLRMLVKHGDKTISQPDLAKKLGLPSTRFLTPLFVSLNKNGGLKKKEGEDGKLLWIPVASKIKAYDAQRGGTAFSNGTSQLNGHA